MYDELLDRVGPNITRQHTRYREPLEPGLQLALTLGHLASVSCYSTMQYGWRVPNNTQSVIVCQLCQAIVDEYLPEVMTCPTTPEEWSCISDKFMQKENFPHACGALDGKHIVCKCPPKRGSQYYIYKGFYSIVLIALVDADYNFIWDDMTSTGCASDAQIYLTCQADVLHMFLICRRYTDVRYLYVCIRPIQIHITNTHILRHMLCVYYSYAGCTLGSR